MSVAAVIAAAALADNIVLAKMLGLCPFAGLSRRLDVAFGVGCATLAVLTFACAAAWLADYFLLADAPALRPAVFIAVVAALVQFAETVMRIKFPVLHRALGVYLPLVATNCAVLGVMLLALAPDPFAAPESPAAQFIRAVAFGFGGGAGFLLAVVVFALVRERVAESQVPESMRGAPLAMLTAGFMALAFSALA